MGKPIAKAPLGGGLCAFSGRACLRQGLARRRVGQGCHKMIIFHELDLNQRRLRCLAPVLPCREGEVPSGLAGKEVPVMRVSVLPRAAASTAALLTGLGLGGCGDSGMPGAFLGPDRAVYRDATSDNGSGSGSGSHAD